jgi:hypothetical protein
MKTPEVRTCKAVVSFLFLAFSAASFSGCVAYLRVATIDSDTSTLHFVGTVLGASGPWMGGGEICYRLRMIGAADRGACTPFSMQAPGIINIEQDITSMVSGGGVTTAQDIYLVINGVNVPGHIQSTYVRHNQINGFRDNYITVQAYFRLPAPLAALETQVHSPAELASALAALEGRPDSVLPPSANDHSAPPVPENATGGSGNGSALSGAATT